MTQFDNFYRFYWFFGNFLGEVLIVYLGSMVTTNY